jgi:alpha-ketoglutarate-dependent taurine dioxygenase
MNTLTVEKLGETVGARVLGVDRERLLDDDALPAWTLRALDEHGALVFRGLHLDDATQVAFSRRLGTVEVPVAGAGDLPEIYLVSRDSERTPLAAYVPGTFDWHIDGCTDDVPIMATMLSAHEVASSGGETEFASTYAAYDDLGDDEKRSALSLRVLHSFEASQLLVNPAPPLKDLVWWRKRPTKIHPLVWRHQSGRRSLVLGATTERVEGMTAAQGRAFLDELLERATRPDRIYRHEWEVGDMVIWDNRGVLHRALPYDASSPRDMHRTTIAGDEPIR